MGQQRPDDRVPARPVGLRSADPAIRLPTYWQRPTGSIPLSSPPSLPAAAVESPPRYDVNVMPAIRRPDRVLMTTPEHFDVEHVINPHMQGNLGAVDHERARAQWRKWREARADADAD